MKRGVVAQIQFSGISTNLQIRVGVANSDVDSEGILNSLYLED